MRNLLLMSVTLVMMMIVVACSGSSNTKTTEVLSTQSDTVVMESVENTETMSDSNVEEQESVEESENAQVKEAGDSKGKLEVLDFFATWCGPCKAMAPAMEQMEKKYAGKIEFRKIDIDKEPELANQYNITGVPTIVVLSRDGKILDSTVGLQTVDELDKMFSALL